MSEAESINSSDKESVEEVEIAEAQQPLEDEFEALGNSRDTNQPFLEIKQVNSKERK